MAKAKTEGPVPAVSAPAAAAPEATKEAPAAAVDIGALLYRDRAAPTREKQVSEGAANFASVTAEAQKAAPVPDEAA